MRAKCLPRRSEQACELIRALRFVTSTLRCRLVSDRMHHHPANAMRKRNQLVVAVFAAASICGATMPAGHCADESGVAARTTNSNRVSFYEVPLVCPAVPQIGC